MATLTGNKISLTYDKVVQVPDQATGILQDGLGAQVYTNSDSIGTIKMFYPVGHPLSYFFNEYPGDGLGVAGKPWEGWAICDGRNGTPDLRGRFIAGIGNNDVNDYGYTNDEKNKSEFASIGDNGGSSQININNIPPHRHLIGLSSVNDNGTSESISDLNGIISAQSRDILDLEAGSRVHYTWPDAAPHDIGDSVVWANSGDGTTNNVFRDGLQSSPSDYYQSYYVIAYVIKIT